MKKYLIIYSILTSVLFVIITRSLRSENQRLAQNQTALTEQCRIYRTRSGEAVAEVQVLRLRIGEFEELRRTDAARLRQAGIKLRRLESLATSATQTDIDFAAPLVDTIFRHDTLPPIVSDTARIFRWADSWASVEGRIRGDTVECHLRSVDTLRQTVQRIPRRFLFFRFGTKALRQTITSSNPHTTVVYTEYIKIEK